MTRLDAVRDMVAARLPSSWEVRAEECLKPQPLIGLEWRWGVRLPNGFVAGFRTQLPPKDRDTAYALMMVEQMRRFILARCDESAADAAQAHGTEPSRSEG